MGRFSFTRRSMVMGAGAIATMARSGMAFARPDSGDQPMGKEVSMSASPQRKGVFMEGRQVPSPRRISEEAQAYLQGIYGQEGKREHRALRFPPVSDHAAWAELKKQVDGGIEVSFTSSGASLKSTSQLIDIAGVKVFQVTPEGGSRRKDCVYLDVHGGALIYGAGEFCRYSARKMADTVGVEVYGPDYRNPPEFPYPAALDDCLAVYRELLKHHKPQNIIVGGSSAGGNLAAAMILRARDEGLPMPAAAVLISPELDLTESGDSFTVLDGLDITYPHSLMAVNLLYADGHDLTHPYLSPLFGDFSKGFPPTFLQCGTRDFFLSNTVLMHRALRQAGVKADLHVFEAMPHGGFQGAPEDQDLADEISRFVSEHWPK